MTNDEFTRHLTLDMDIFAHQSLLILGLARQGLALARFAAGVGAKVTVSDLRQAEHLTNEVSQLSDLDISFELGGHPVSLLDDCDVVAISGSVPADAPFVNLARARGLPITNDSQEFFRRSPTKHTVGLTGSAGKTTTTALVGHLLKTANISAWVGGNIGHPLIQDLGQIKTEDVVVQELSSFQLELWEESPHIAAVTNITPNHLDRHKTMAQYTSAKMNILRHQSADDIAILNRDDAGSYALASMAAGRVRTFSLDGSSVEDGAFVQNGRIMLHNGAREIPIMATRHVPLIGQHNLANVLAAITIVTSVDEKIGPAALSHGIRTFQAVPHRLELITEQNGVRYINDSIATAPERALAGLQALQGESIILLAGGKDKNMVWEPWAEAVCRSVKTVVLFGSLADLMAEKLARAGRRDNIFKTDSVANAVEIGIEHATSGDIILLSPGGTSYDAFKDFEERGNHFKSLIGDLLN